MRLSGKIAIAFVMMMLLALLAYAQEQPAAPKQVPLGDIAKQKPAKKAMKVITDDDIPQRPPDPAPVPAATTSPGAGQAPGSEPTDKAAADKTAPAAALSPEDARTKKLDELKRSEEAEKRIIQKLEESLREPDLTENRRNMYLNALKVGREALERITAERQQLEQQPAAAKPVSGNSSQK